MKIVISGTHYTPAQAVIEELKKISNAEIIYIGRRTTREGDKSLSVESQIMPGLEVKFIPIIAGRLQRKFTIYTIPSLLKIPVGIIQSFYLMMVYQPDVVLSFGGYVSVPVVISAWLWGIPIITHEQTLVTGLANQINGCFADKIAVSFGSQIKSNKKMVLTGNPIRNEVLTPLSKNIDLNRFINNAKKEKMPIIIVSGGSQGAHVINQTIMDALSELTNVAFIIHQTGDSKFNDFEEAEEKRKTLKSPNHYFVKKWFEGSAFGYILKNADIAVGRAGINTLLECAYFGVPAIAVPIPYLSRNEQNVNAKYFENIGLVKILLQEDLSGKTLVTYINSMLKNLNSLKEKAKRSKNIIIFDAAKKLALEAILLAGNK